MSNLKEQILNKLSQDFVSDNYYGLSRLNLTKPHIYVEISSSSIISGIDLTIAEIKKYFEEQVIEYELIETSCKGIHIFQPAISIQMPGRNAISFKNVYYNLVSNLLDSILNNILPTDKAVILGQHFHPDLSSWADVADIEELSIFRLQNRKLLKFNGILQPLSINSYIEHGGYYAFAKILKTKTPIEICNELEASGLRGRGGGGYNTGSKWKIVLNIPSNKKYFICNADESDPNSLGGKLLIESNPHMLIEGLLIGAYAINASEAIIYINAKHKLAIERIENAIKQAKEFGLCGEDIFNSAVNIRISLYKGPGAYVCGEETALIASLEGKRAMPKAKPPYPTESGLFGYPTIVNNVETIYNASLVFREGSEKFKQSGTYLSYGTKLYTINGNIDFSGILEIEMGKTVNYILKIINLNENLDNIKAVHLGGPTGAFVHPDNFSQEITYDTLTKGSLWFGSGSFVVIDDNNCILDLTKHFLNYLNQESCGKCIPCREGTQQLLEIIRRLTEKPDANLRHDSLIRFKGLLQLKEISEVMRQTSLCGLGKNAPESVLSSLEFFENEYEEHIFEKNCKAGVCTNLKEYLIIVEACVGCGICAKRCPTDAIIGCARTTHFIVQDKCIKCGICYDACKFDAIKVN